MTEAPILKHFDDLQTFRISPADTVKLTHLTGPVDGSQTSVFFEIWEPGGAQPDNSHADSVEIFIVLKGSGTAQSDDHEVAITAGDVLILPKGSMHHITNTSRTERLYTVTIMANDEGALTHGFEHLVTNGSITELDAIDRSAIIPTLASTDL